MKCVGQLFAPAACSCQRVVLHMVCVVLVLVLMAVPAFAVKLPEATAEDGNTVLGTFITSTLEEDKKEFLREWMASDRNLLVRLNDGAYEFFILAEGTTVDVTVLSNGCKISLRGGTARGLIMMGWSSGSPEFNGSTACIDYSVGSVVYPCYIVSSTAHLTLPIPTGGYVAEYDGSLILRDDGGLFGAGGEGGGWWQGLLDWLAEFWDALWNFFLRLFVPEQGYFEKWVKEISDAATEKLGAVFDMYTAMQDLFSSLQTDAGQSGSLKITLPPNLLYQGYSGASVDVMPTILKFTGFLRPLFSAIVLLMTLIICYKRVVVLFEQ